RMDDSFGEELFGDCEPSEVLSGDEVKPITDNFADVLERILKGCMTTSKFSEMDVSALGEAVFKRYESNWTSGAELILSFLVEVAEMEWYDNSKSAIRLFATVAIRMMREKELDAMWRVIQTHCDETCFCVLEDIRLHGCLVMAECLRIVNEIVESERESQPSELNDLRSFDCEGTQTAKLYNLIPRALIERWAKVLSQRRLDKSSAVRAVGVSAVSALPHSNLPDYEGREFIPNDLIIESLRDVDVKVREAAIKALSILSVDHIEETMNRLRSEEKPEIRRLLAAKLIQEVHVMSYSEDQRASLLSFLYNNSDRILSRMARERLIPKWEEEQDGDSALNSLFNPSDEGALRIYISTLFADDLKKSASSWEFVEIMKEENPEMLCLDNWEKSVTSLSASELSYGVLLLECTLSVLSQKGEVSSCLSRLAPSLADVCRSMKKVSVSWLSGSEAERQEEKLMVRVLKLVALFDRFDSDGMLEWESFLRYLIISPEVKPSKILIQVCMDQLIGVFGNEKAKMEEMRRWAVGEMENLLFEGEKATEDDSLKWRCSLILHSLVKGCHSIDEKIADLTARLMDETFVSEWDMQRELNCIIISIVGCANKDFLDETKILMLKKSLEIDVESVKIACLRGLVDLISVHSPPVMANLMFPDWEEEVISRETKMYQLFDGYVDPTNKSTLSQIALQCTLRLLHDWCPPCPVSIYNLLLFTTRENEGERAALENAIMEEMKRRVEMSRPFRMMVAHSMYCLIERQKGENAYKCSIMSTLMKSMLILKNKREEEEKDEETIDFEEWLIPMIILDAIIEDPESSLNRALVNSLGCMKNDEGGNGHDMVVKKMETAIDRLAIYDEKSTSKSLVKILEKMDGRRASKRKGGWDNKRGRKRVKKEEDHDGTQSETRTAEDDIH
ncbi:hypothetical protein PMAYCL1PPCAC_07069, partial [Pristionchus mayeri]